MKVEFPEQPPIGLAVSLDDQRYDLVDAHDHQKLDGTMTVLLVWQAECATCGEGFLTKSPANQLPGGRRCEKHRQPGKKVRP